MKGTMYIWCDACQLWQPTDPERAGTCPKCGHVTIKMKCLRCGYMWEAKKGVPKRCANPSCRSPYYNRKRVRI